MNGVITSVGLMVWAYASMRALYQAEEAKTWPGVVQAILGVGLINYFCYELLMNSASLNEFKTTSQEGVNTIGFLLLLGTVASGFIAVMRASLRLEGRSVAVHQAEVEKPAVSLTPEETARVGT